MDVDRLLPDLLTEPTYGDAVSLLRELTEERRQSREDARATARAIAAPSFTALEPPGISRGIEL